MYNTSDSDNEKNSAYPPQQPQRQQSVPQTVYNPAGYSVTQPQAEKRNAIFRSNQAGEKKYQEYKEIRTQRSRELTQGPPKQLGGKSLSQTELQEKWRSEEAHAKRKQLIADYEKKERRREYQRQEKAGIDKEIQEKKSRARDSAIKQDRTERDRTIAHDEVMKQQRLQHFDPMSTSSLPKRLTESERAEKQQRETLDAFKQQKLAEHAKQESREAYKREERGREERENMEKKMCARELAIKQSITDRERVAADSDIAREQRLKYFDNKK